MGLNKRRLTVSAAVVIGLFIPAAPATSAAKIPVSQRITGTVQTVIREQSGGRGPEAADSIKALRVGTRLVPLIDGSLPATRDGTKVSVTVAPAAAGTSLVTSASTISAPVSAAASPASPSSHKVYVALVLPAGISADASLTETAVRATVIRASMFWSSQTGGKVSFVTAQVLPIYQSALKCGDTFSMMNEAMAKMPAAYGPDTHVVVVSPAHATSLGCDYGLGTIGNGYTDTNSVFVSGLSTSVLAHELGHNLGLYHSNSLRCGSAQDMPRVGLGFPGCRGSDYDDLFDVMGYTSTYYGEGNLNAVHLDGMNLLPNAVRKIAANSGVTTARISPLSAPLSASTTNRTLKVTDPSGANYFVEYRTNSGRDAVARLNPWRPAWGVRVLRDDPTAPPSAGSYEMDATPTSLTNDYNRAIPVGGTFTAASRKLTIRVTAADASGATLLITNAAVAIVPINVTMSLRSQAMVGAAIAATTRVTDQSGRPSANWTVTLQKKQKGTSTWTSVKSVRTTSSGAASYTFLNGLSGYYRWVTAAATRAPSRFSPLVTVTSIARIRENRPVASMTRGTYLAVFGSVSAIPSPMVYVQYRPAGGIWRNGPRATVKGTAVSGRIAINSRATAYTRLYVRSATSYAGSVSGYFATSVR